MEFPNHSRQLLQRLQQQRCQGFLCDCTVVVGETRFRAHRAVLASCSAYFHLFYKERTDALDVVQLNDAVVTAPAFSLLLEFMYRGKLESPGMLAEEVLAAASYLHMYDIVRECASKLDEAQLLPLRKKVNERIALGAKDRERRDTEMHHKRKMRTSLMGQLETNNKQVRPTVSDHKVFVQSVRKAKGRITQAAAPVPQSHARVGRETRASIGGRATPPSPRSWVLGDEDGVLDLSCKAPPGEGPSPGPVAGQLDEGRQDTLSLDKAGRGLGGQSELEGTQRQPLRTSARSPAQTPELPEQEWGRGEGGEHGKVEGGGALTERSEEEEEEENGDVSTFSGADLALRRRHPRPNSLSVCPLCRHRFPSPELLQRHLETHFRERGGTAAEPAPSRGGEVKPACRQCGKTFSCLYTLKRHERTHSGEKPYTCARCGKGFQYSHNLTRHAVVHTRQKPHGCWLCERRFTQSGDLYRHIRKFHHGAAEVLAVR